MLKRTGMMESLKVFVISSCFILFLFIPLSFAQFKYIETENVKLVYIGGAHSYLIPHTLRCYENSLKFHREIWNYTPYEKPIVVLHDFTDFGNAGASTIPRNRIAVAVAPFSFAYETAPANERINAIMNHELVHIVAGDKCSGRDRFFRRLFSGKVQATTENPLSIVYEYLTSPRRSAPYWYHEGIAVFFETWMAGGLGRALGPYDEMVFRTKVRDSARFYDHVGLEAEAMATDFQVGVNAYLYGTRFMSYLALRFGPESLIDWVNRTNGSSSYFGSQFSNVYKISMDEAWNDWVEWEHEFQKKNLEAIRGYSTTPYRQITENGLGSVSRAFLDRSNNRLLTALYHPGRPAYLASISMVDGKISHLHDVKGPALFFVTSLAYDSTTGNLFYTANNNEHREVHLYNVFDGDAKQLMDDVRIGDLVFNYFDSSLWGVRHYNAISTLVRMPYPYDEWNQIYSWPYGKDVYDLDISSDGRFLSASLSHVSGRQTLILMNIDSLIQGDTTYTTLHNFGNSIPMNFVFADGGRYLYGSSYYTGVANIFRYDIQLDTMEAVTNCETGMFRPIPLDDDSLLVFRYTADGFAPAKVHDTITEDINPITYLGQQVVEKHPSLKDWMISAPSEVTLDSLLIDSGKYNSLANMRVGSVYPIVAGYKDAETYGMRMNLAEPVGLRQSQLTVSYSPDARVADNERWHGSWGYHYLNWDLGATYNAADFYDLFGPTKTSRKGYSLSVQHQKTLYQNPPKSVGYSMKVAWFGNLQRLPDYQNVNASFDRFLSISARIVFQSAQASIGAVDYEQGLRWELRSSNNIVNGTVYPQVIQNLDFGIPLPVYHSSFWLRSSVGYSYGDRFEPFANFYFGGFGNNWVDHQGIKRYRKYYSLPGLELNEIAATNFAKLSAELNLPPLRFRRIGISSFYFTWLRISFFATGIATNIDTYAYDDRVTSLGGQADLRMVLLSHLRFTFSVGYAAAYDRGEYYSDEVMVSLKVL